MLPLGNGKLLIANSSDGRRDYSPKKTSTFKKPPPDPYNNDLWSDAVDLGPATGAIPVVATSSAAGATSVVDRTEALAIEAVHAYRGGPDKDLHIVRGEFHRHSEISMDGGNDGTILDQWRYILDAAASTGWVAAITITAAAREYSWWITQKLTDIFYAPGKFIPMFSYERSVVIRMVIAT